jgi:hypothetical protein
MKRKHLGVLQKPLISQTLGDGVRCMLFHRRLHRQIPLRHEFDLHIRAL